MTADNPLNMTVDIAVQDPAWEEIDSLQALTERALETAFGHADMLQPKDAKAIEISIVFANDELIQVLNREYRGQDKPTNVLSFAQQDEKSPTPPDTIVLGDVVLSFETITREAQEQSKFFIDHVVHMLVHGTLHLLGYDHDNDDDASVMETTEIRILEKLGIQNPYTEMVSRADHV